MKNFSLLSVVIAVVLMVTAVSCTTMRETSDDYYYDRTAGSSNRIYVDDPYRGTVVLERDPYSGRYYEIGTYGASPYGYRNDRYSSVNSRNYRKYRNNGSWNGNYNQNNNNNTYQGGTQNQTREQRRDEARKKVLGN